MPRASRVRSRPEWSRSATIALPAAVCIASTVGRFCRRYHQIYGYTGGCYLWVQEVRAGMDGAHCTVQCSCVAMVQLILSHLTMMKYYGHCSLPDCCQASLNVSPSTEGQSPVALFFTMNPQICLVPPRRGGVLSSTTYFV